MHVNYLTLVSISIVPMFYVTADVTCLKKWHINSSLLLLSLFGKEGPRNFSKYIFVCVP